MKKLSQKAFIAEHTGHLSPSLVRAVIRQAGGWSEFQEAAPNIARYGASGGFSGFFFYNETVPFARRHVEAILDYLTDFANDCGEGDAFTVIANFNGLRRSQYTPTQISRAVHGKPRNDDEHGEQTDILNALAWCALEEVARAYADAVEE